MTPEGLLERRLGLLDQIGSSAGGLRSASVRLPAARGFRPPVDEAPVPTAWLVRSAGASKLRR
jgi:hypothetical protein